MLQLLLFLSPYPHYLFLSSPLLCLGFFPFLWNDFRLNTAGIPTYTLCMAMHYLTISSQGLSLLLMDTIPVPVLAQLLPIPELA